MPVEVTWGKGVGDAFGANVSPLATTGWLAMPRTAGVVLRFPSETVRGEARGALERSITTVRENGGLPADARVSFEPRGAFLRLRVDGDLSPRPRAGEGAEEDLGVLREAVARFTERRGRPPTQDEGIAALASEGLLDEMLGVVPKDPWGTPYRYRPPAEPRPMDLRSLGPDREVDTEDDVLPEE
jgi:hypothetical protein